MEQVIRGVVAHVPSLSRRGICIRSVLQIHRGVIHLSGGLHVSRGVGFVSRDVVQKIRGVAHVLRRCIYRSTRGTRISNSNVNHVIPRRSRSIPSRGSCIPSRGSCIPKHGHVSRYMYPRRGTCSHVSHTPRDTYARLGVHVPRMYLVSKYMHHSSGYM